MHFFNVFEQIYATTKVRVSLGIFWIILNILLPLNSSKWNIQKIENLKISLNEHKGKSMFYEKSKMFQRVET